MMADLSEMILMAMLVSLCAFVLWKQWGRWSVKMGKFDLGRFDCRFLVDTDQKLFHFWLSNDTRKNVQWVTGDMFGYPVQLSKLQTAPHCIYPHRFPSVTDTENTWYLRCGKLLNVDRFQVALVPKNKKDSVTIFGYIECLFVDSYRLNGTIGWLYHVYVAPEHRQKGLGCLMIKHCLKYFNTKQVRDVYLCVNDDNIAAQRLYHKCGFESYETVVDKEHGLTYFVLKHSA